MAKAQSPKRPKPRRRTVIALNTLVVDGRHISPGMSVKIEADEAARVVSLKHARWPERKQTTQRGGSSSYSGVQSAPAKRT